MSVSIDFRVKSQFDSQFDSLSREVSRGVADLGNSWEVILMSALFALVFAYVYMYLTKKLAGVLIWLCIALVICGGFFLGFSFLREAGNAPASSSSNRVLAYRVAGYIFIGASSLFGLIILGLSGQIKLAIEVIKEASKAVNDMKLIIFFPLLPLLMAGAYLVYWVYGALFIFSVSDRRTEAMPSALLTREDTMGTWAHFGAPEKAGTTITALAGVSLTYYDINDSFRPLAAWHVFHGLWSIQLLVYWGYFVIAGQETYACTEQRKSPSSARNHSTFALPPIRSLQHNLNLISHCSLPLAFAVFRRCCLRVVLFTLRREWQ